MNEPLTKDKIHLCVNAACKQGEHVDIADVASAVRLLREKIIVALRAHASADEYHLGYSDGLREVLKRIDEIFGGVEK